MSLKKNFAYNSILTLSNYIFPLIVFPYVTRVLGVKNLGISNFYTSVMGYFVLIAMIGVATVGIREIATTKDDKNKLSQTFNSILFINIISTIVSLIILFVLANSIDKFSEHPQMIVIGSLQVFFNTFLVEWLYKGLEEFRYITVRTICVKIIYTISVIIFVRDTNDYDIYFLLNNLMIVINALINIIHAKKYINFSFKGIQPSLYIKTCLILGVYGILTSMYTSFNIMYLGFVCGDTEVGYYTTATKLYGVIIALFSAFTGVMMPKLSYLVSSGDKERFISLINKSFSILIIFSIPLIYYSEVFATEIIKLVAGNGYEEAVFPMQLVTPLVFIIGYEQITVIQILTPLKKDNAILINSTIGAVVGIIFNILLVHSLRSVGSAIVWISSELAVLISSQYFVQKETGIKFPFIFLLKHLLCLSPILILNICISKFNMSYIMNMFIGGSVTVLMIFVIEYYILKESFFIQTINQFIIKWRKR